MDSTRRLTWPTQTKKFIRKKFLIITPKKRFSQTKKFLTSASEKQFSTQRRNFLYLTKKITNFITKKILYTCLNKYLTEKTEKPNFQIPKNSF